MVRRVGPFGSELTWMAWPLEIVPISLPLNAFLPISPALMKLLDLLN